MFLSEISKVLSSVKDKGCVDPSFLEIIDKGSNENMVSKYLLYLLKNDIEFLNAILRHCYKDEFYEVDSVEFACTEYVISEKKRIDILIQGRDVKDQKVLIVIENKIYSHEGLNQCNNYYKYCSVKYKDHKQYYLFLYPDFNPNIKTLSNENFVKMTYTQLSEVLNSLETRTAFENDFIKLVNNQLRSIPMDELTTFFIDHLKQIKDKIDSIESVVRSVFDSFKDYYLEMHEDFTFQFKDNHSTLRFYKNIPAWWTDSDKYKKRDDDKFYFYIELKREENLRFYVQRSLKIYSNNLNSRINRYLQSLETPLVAHGFGYHFKVFERKEITSDFKKLSNEWKNNLFEEATRILDEFAEKQEKETQRFSQFDV